MKYVFLAAVLGLLAALLLDAIWINASASSTALTYTVTVPLVSSDAGLVLSQDIGPVTEVTP